MAIDQERPSMYLRLIAAWYLFFYVFVFCASIGNDGAGPCNTDVPWLQSMHERERASERAKELAMNERGPTSATKSTFLFLWRTRRGGCWLVPLFWLLPLLLLFAGCCHRIDCASEAERGAPDSEERTRAEIRRLEE